jgi:hypothetical protein
MCVRMMGPNCRKCSRSWPERKKIILLKNTKTHVVPLSNRVRWRAKYDDPSDAAAALQTGATPTCHRWAADSQRHRRLTTGCRAPVRLRVVCFAAARLPAGDHFSSVVHRSPCTNYVAWCVCMLSDVEFHCRTRQRVYIGVNTTWLFIAENDFYNSKVPKTKQKTTASSTLY